MGRMSKVNGDDQPATKGDLRELETRLRTVETRMATKDDLRAMEERMLLELGGVIERAIGMNAEDYQRGVTSSAEHPRRAAPRARSSR